MKIYYTFAACGRFSHGNCNTVLSNIHEHR